MNDISILTQELSKLYEKAGYKKYKMRKFEEYSLYLENKNFLTSEYVITFNDLSGKLLALKPDVTLSIVKNTNATLLSSEKLYYTESVYRLDARSHEYKEIHQMGLEMLGDIDEVATLEILALALESLEATGMNYALNISHMGIINPLLADAVGENLSLKEQLIGCIKSKNLHDMRQICAQAGISAEKSEPLCAAASVGGDFEAGLQFLKNLNDPGIQNALIELTAIFNGLKSCGKTENIRLDLSIINDVNYYNGIVFQGYLAGIHRHILSGGRYDHLAGKFKAGIGAMGFAVYLSDLTLFHSHPEYDCDILLHYNSSVPAAQVLKEAEKLRDTGKRVRVERHIPPELKYKELKEI